MAKRKHHCCSRVVTHCLKVTTENVHCTRGLSYKANLPECYLYVCCSTITCEAMDQKEKDESSSLAKSQRPWQNASINAAAES